GIETSCDETAAAVVESGERLLSNVVASQIDVHRRYGGVVPELASREQLRAIVPVVRQAVEDAGIGYRDVGAVGVTCGPGLVGSLLVGLCYAKALSLSWGVPLIGVNHIEGHIHAVVLEQKQKGEPVEFPALALVASGGHTHLFHVRSDGDGDWSYRLLGRTRDDAAGEAFDKVAKLLGLGYPGGPVIDSLAPHGNPEAVRFSPAKMKGNDLDFSFSGLKTAVLRHVQAAGMEEEIERRRALGRATPRPSVEQWREATPQATLDLIASFQKTVIEELLRHALRAAGREEARSIIISGGVACNAGLRRRFAGEAAPYHVYFPSPRLSTDNAAMIAAAAYPKFLRGTFSDLSLAADASLSL
ncbi:MAG TPA: tRNA (adenosine(37)-N6)-threonylcarbamoyltransferase complex transferase subunit TsaD, partial [Bryobacterales bacterium]|nr:tRNA (adenosine(37)-N6)-threonylcarbamoyltransferase complex transferase subunit TsaD [Bryobacterales bacterium]